MREILFRGKRVDNVEWVEGFYCKHDTVKVCLTTDDPKTKHLIITDGFCDWGFEPPCLAHEVIPETVDQYTGLKDKNGKKIFEGDIIKSDNGRISAVSVVKYGDYRPDWFYSLIEWAQGYKPKESSYGFFCDSGDEQFLLVNSPSLIEIIGNIHDNPELLEG